MFNSCKCILIMFINQYNIFKKISILAFNKFLPTIIIKLKKLISSIVIFSPIQRYL